MFLIEGWQRHFARLKVQPAPKAAVEEPKATLKCRFYLKMGTHQRSTLPLVTATRALGRVVVLGAQCRSVSASWA